ncbi:amino-acid permease BAT1-like protein [Raphidocelis subcapitata]|uniref:Amino-acid permease BAT1-like protein n=1 Tax=Raphidocelis subcapitata TaxID=307507 RepID=A0A2V0NSN6_9CHLO|nr:amino-acid permease BAT1-like protein [Raphidocelis subcapitata]|eukprot:GBF90646.1 amino-acid permease BAT1-like protein [Raphidocelis subcapitata]
MGTGELQQGAPPVRGELAALSVEREPGVPPWLPQEEMSLHSEDAADDARLVSLGYQPQLRRDFRLLTSLAISFTIVSVLTGLTGLYGLGYQYGGPAAIIWSWPICVAFTTCIAAALGELCSAYPTSGGVYFWSYAVAPKSCRALAAWLTLWFNLTGLVGVEAGINFTFAATFEATLQLAYPGFSLGAGGLFGVYAAITVIHGLINMLPIHYIGIMNCVSIGWHIAVTAVFCVLLPAVAPTHQPASFVFGKIITADKTAGINNVAYSVLLSALMSQFTLTGYEASAKMAEESRKASTTSPWAIILTVLTSGVVGWVYLLATTFSIVSPDTLLSPDNATGGKNVFAQVLYDASVARFGDARAAIALLALILPAQAFAGASCLVDASRALFAFARDRAVPHWMAWVHPKTRVPIVATWVMVAASQAIALPMLGSLQAFTAVTSIATIGSYLSYGAPIALHLFTQLFRCSTFQPGPWHLGKWSIPICAVATFWVLFLTALFVLPTVLPVTPQTLNYAGALAGSVLVAALVMWVVSARKWFDGPNTSRKLAERSLLHGGEADGGGSSGASKGP